MKSLAEIVAEAARLEPGQSFTARLDVPIYWTADYRIKQLNLAEARQTLLEQVGVMFGNSTDEITNPGPILAEVIEEGLRGSTLMALQAEEAVFIVGMVESLKQLLNTPGRLYTIDHAWGSSQITISRERLNMVAVA